MACYREQWQPERGFHRLKGGVLAITPLFLQDDTRIRGLVVLLMIALRVLTLVEFVVRRNLTQQGEALPGLYAGNPARKSLRKKLLRTSFYESSGGFADSCLLINIDRLQLFYLYS